MSSWGSNESDFIHVWEAVSDSTCKVTITKPSNDLVVSCTNTGTVPNPGTYSGQHSSLNKSVSVYDGSNELVVTVHANDTVGGKKRVLCSPPGTSAAPAGVIVGPVEEWEAEEKGSG